MQKDGIDISNMEVYTLPKNKETEFVNLWKPSEVVQEEPTKGLFQQYNKALSLIAKKLARKFDLDEHDFVIRLWLDRKDRNFRAEIHRGVILRIYFGVLPTASDFDSVIKSTLKQARRIRGSKAIEKVDRIEGMRSWVTSKFPVVKETNKFTSFDIEVVIMRKVEVRHKGTGLIVTRDSVEGKATWRQLIEGAKIELAENLELVEKLEKKENNNVEARNESTVHISERGC